jgi:putative peptidoglycan lipid II flippase
MTTMMPILARRAQEGDVPGLRREFGLGLRYIVVLVVPASILFAVLAQPMLAVIVRHEFTAHDAAVTADTLQVFALSLVPFSVYLYTMRAFYALQDTRTPFLLNAFENALNIALALLLFSPLGVQGLALAWTGAYTVAAVVALWVLRRRIRGVPDKATIRSMLRACIAGALLAVVAAPIAAAVGHSSPTEALLATVLAGAAGSAVYLLGLVLMRSDELAALVSLVRRRATTSPGV